MSPFERATGSTLIVYALIDTRGRIVDAQIIKGRDRPAPRLALVRSLRQWRLESAIRGGNRAGRPWPVHFMLEVEVPRPAGAPH